VEELVGGEKQVTSVADDYVNPSEQSGGIFGILTRAYFWRWHGAQCFKLLDGLNLEFRVMSKLSSGTAGHDMTYRKIRSKDIQESLVGRGQARECLLYFLYLRFFKVHFDGYVGQIENKGW
jgi:hypothetical protein